MEPFDPIQSPLQGKCLIEAGAGTGKTYTITTLVLRLILEVALPLEAILVVTFTTAATAELRDRVRHRLKTAQRALRGMPCEDPQLDRLLDRCDSREIALDRLEDALANYDRMPIFTIHGFCQRILNEMAFETGSAFDAELVTDTPPIVQRVADDFWRRIWAGAPPELLRFALPKMQSPEHLAILYNRYAVPLMDIRPADPDPSPPCMADFRAQWSQVREQWRECRDAVLALLAAPGLKANIYGSTTAPGGDAEAPSKREEKINAWARALDRWTGASTEAFPPPDALAYFTRDKIFRSVKKGAAIPQHPFFEQCQQIREETRLLEERMQTWLVGTYVRFFHAMAEGLRRTKQEAGALFFDDLLMMVHDALQQADSNALKRMLQMRYRAVLIDEFQDTDAIQYAIFNNLFGGGDHLMAMIGDPKQAIYSFRGADIFTYLRAARDATRRYTLTQNWRSTPGLVAAQNTLFGRHPQPFLWPEIAYHRAEAATGQRPLRPVEDRFPALTIWFLDNPPVTARRRTFNKQTAGDRILTSLVGEVRRLAAASKPGEGGVAFQDMAVLVRTNRQAQEVKGWMADTGVPAVIYNAGSVFHQPEALDLRRLLRAVENPSRERSLRTALATPFFGRRANELAFDEDVPDWWSAAVDRFYDYRDLWQRDGFMRMFRQLAVREEIAARLLARQGGERYFTNVLHLAELLHKASLEQSLGASELIQWLDARRMQVNDTADAHQMRLESDDQAVTIMTVHKSKGLEFPIVFHPFAWEGKPPPRPPALCHQDDRSGHRLLDLGSDALERNLARMAEEQAAEEIRLLYVALTRARERCYLVWGPLPSFEHAALAYLIYSGGDTDVEMDYPERRRKLAAFCKAADGSALRLPLEELADQSEGLLAVVDLPEPPSRSMPASAGPAALPEARVRQYQRGPMPTWKIASFSSLISHRREVGEIQEDGPEPAQEDFYNARSHPAADGEPSRHIGEIAHFEAGPRAGVFLHEILENIDFTGAALPGWREVITTRMRVHGIEDRWESTLHDLLRRVVDTPLEEGPGHPFALRQIPTQDRLSELAFHLPLRPVDAVSLERVFSDVRQTAFRDKLGGLLEQLAFSLSGGYLKGFIDLVFRHDGRYYLADWKSNLLGDAFDAYHTDRLADIMINHYYFLQYHIYVLALDRYLESCVRNYRYAKHFGGVYYFFIRGMGGLTGPATGVFFDRPDAAFVRRLEKTLII